LGHGGALAIGDAFGMAVFGLRGLGMLLCGLRGLGTVVSGLRRLGMAFLGLRGRSMVLFGLRGLGMLLCGLRGLGTVASGLRRLGMAVFGLRGQPRFGRNMAQRQHHTRTAKPIVPTRQKLSAPLCPAHSAGFKDIRLNSCSTGADICFTQTSGWHERGALPSW
jgi:hypothetical protein